MLTKSIPLSAITINTRIRRDLGDLTSLAANIREVGLLSPIIVNEDNELLAGERRLEACKLLGYTEIAASVVSTADEEQKLAIEIAENQNRKSFSREELINAGIELERIEKIKAESYRKSKLKQNATVVQHVAPRDEKGKVRDIISKKLGISHTEYERQKYVIANKDMFPDEYEKWNNHAAPTKSIYDKIRKQYKKESEPAEVIKEVPPPDYDELKQKVEEQAKLLEERNTTPDEELTSLQEELQKKDKEIESLKKKQYSPGIQAGNEAYDFYVAAQDFAKKYIAPLLCGDNLKELGHASYGDYISKGCTILQDSISQVYNRMRTKDVIDVESEVC